MTKESSSSSSLSSDPSDPFFMMTQFLKSGCFDKTKLKDTLMEFETLIKHDAKFNF